MSHSLRLASGTTVRPHSPARGALRAQEECGTCVLQATHSPTRTWLQLTPSLDLSETQHWHGNPHHHHHHHQWRLVQTACAGVGGYYGDGDEAKQRPQQPQQVEHLHQHPQQSERSSHHYHRCCLTTTMMAGVWWQVLRLTVPRLHTWRKTTLAAEPRATHRSPCLRSVPAPQCPTHWPST